MAQQLPVHSSSHRVQKEEEGTTHKDMSEMQNGHNSKGISRFFCLWEKNTQGEQRTKDRCGKRPEERRKEETKGHFIIRVTQGSFRWEKGSGRKDNYEALLVPRDIEEEKDKCGATTHDKEAKSAQSD